MLQSYKLYGALLALIFFKVTSEAQTAKSYGVMVQRDLTSAQVKLTWDYDATTSSYTIYRKSFSAKAWGMPIANLTATDTAFIDDISNGLWEYYVQRNLSNGKRGHGYLLTHTQIAEAHSPGRIMVVIDDAYRTALASEINQTIIDLVGDGYTVDTMYVSRNTSVTSIKQTLTNWYFLHRYAPLKAQSVYLIGHVPVPYSGLIFPDGHTPDHKGAWPADVYYACMGEELFTDAWVNQDSATGTRNDNIPGDGKFDVDLLYPDSSVFELGRVDLSNMPAFGVSDTVLLQRYLKRAHEFKRAEFVPNRKAVVDDNFGAMNGEAFASSGWRSYSAALGKEHVIDADYMSSIKQQSYLMSYGCGAGTYTGASGVGTTSSFVSDSINTVFTMLFGSYFGDWDATNSFLRAPLCSKPMSLTSVWSGRPHWNLHHMAMGYPIGYSARLTQNNVDGRLLTPQQVSGYVTNNFPTYVHIALMGDPTLKLFYKPTVTNFAALPNPDSTSFTFTWNSTPGALQYFVYVSPSMLSPGNLVAITTDTVLTTTKVFPGANYVSVRAKYIEQSASGKYYQFSLGSHQYVEGGTNAVGLNPINSASYLHFVVYPNPSQKQFSILGVDEISHIEVMDLQGKLVQSTTLLPHQISISHQLLPGLYVVKVTAKKGIGYQKLVVQ